MPDPIEGAAQLVETFEGFRSSPYRDAVGVWTIGYGSTHGPDGEPVTADTEALSEAQADGLVRGSLKAIQDKLNSALKVVLTDHQKIALLSFCYNVGTAAFLRSTMFRLINSHYITKAASQFPLWVHAGGRVLPGLVRRRAAERAVYLTPDK